MPNIPLAKIPQAPQGGSTYTPIPEGTVRAPNFTRGAAMVAGAANLLRQDTLPVAAFGGTEDTFKAFGEAGTRIANIFGNYAQSMAQAADEGNFAAADRMVTEAKAAHAVETSTMPESQWADVWQKKYLPKLQEQIGGMSMTPVGRARLNAWWTNQQGDTNAAIAVSANKQFIQNATQEGMAYAERERLNGNNENAFGIVGRLAARGMISNGDKERILLGWEKEDKAKTNETVWANTHADVQAYFADPNNPLDGLSKEIDEAIASKSWTTENFPQYNGKRQELLRLQSVIKAEERDALLTRKRDAMEAIANNYFADEDEIRATYENSLPKTEVDNLVAAFQLTPDQIESRLAMQPDIIRMIEQFRPQDDANGTVEVNLVKAIHTQPAGFQQQLIERLRERKRESKPEASSYVDDRLKMAEQQFRAGEFGEWRMDKDGNPKDVDNEWAPARMAMSKRTDALKAWAKQNPQDASDPTKVNKAWNDIKLEFYKADKAAGKNVKQPTMDIPDPAAVKARVQDARKGASAPTTDDTQTAGTWRVTDKTRDYAGRSKPGARQTSLDFNGDKNLAANRAEIVIPHNATPQEERAAGEYVQRVSEFFASKGVNVPVGENGGILRQTGSGVKVNRFHTEPFFAHNAEARKAIEENPEEYAAILAETLGGIPGMTFIAPHNEREGKQGTAFDDGTTETKWARTHIIPALKRLAAKQSGNTRMARK